MTTAATAIIDLAPTLNTVVLPLLTSVAMGAMTWVAGMIATHFHVQISDANRQLVETAISNGIAYAQSKAAPNETLSAPATVAAAVGYVLPKIPSALAWLKITPASLEQLITARLPS